MEQAILMYDPCLRYQYNKKTTAARPSFTFANCRSYKRQLYNVKLKHIATMCAHTKERNTRRSIVCGYACSREVELRKTTSLSTNIADLRPSLISAISDSTAMRPISA